jgi:hypothetical protein
MTKKLIYYVNETVHFTLHSTATMAHTTYQEHYAAMADVHNGVVGKIAQDGLLTNCAVLVD